jgi:hypothetical protein
MKRIALFSIPILVVALVLGGLLLGLPKSAAAQDANPPRVVDTSRDSGPAPAAPRPEWSGTWEFAATSPFTYTRCDSEYFSANGLVYFMGGRMADNSTDGSVWVWNPATGIYTDTAVDLVTPISNYTMNLLQDATGWGFYVFCGRTGAGGQTLIPQVYYPATNTAAELGPEDAYPGTGTCSSGLNVVYNNQVYMVGGFDGTLNYGETWVFDPMAAAGSRWTQIATANLAQPRAYIMGAMVDGLIYAIGGTYWDAGGGTLVNVPTVEVLDPNDATPAWDDGAADLPEACSESRRGLTSTFIPTRWNAAGWQDRLCLRFRPALITALCLRRGAELLGSLPLPAGGPPQRGGHLPAGRGWHPRLVGLGWIRFQRLRRAQLG